jgi:hypothetical protein
VANQEGRRDRDQLASAGHAIAHARVDALQPSTAWTCYPAPSALREERQRIAEGVADPVALRHVDLRVVPDREVDRARDEAEFVRPTVELEGGPGH